jgi:hypothetical protein
MPLPHPGGAVLYVSTSVGGSFALALERAAFGLNVRKGMARTTTSCRKSETKLSMPMNNLALPHAKMLAPVPPLRTREKSPRKNFPRFKPRNPLKSLESDERIQGNPRQFNPHDRGPSERNSHEPRKPKRSTGPRSRLVTGTEPNRIHPNAKRPRPRKSACEMRVAKGAAFLAACPRLPTRAAGFQARPRPRAAE